MQLNWQRIDNNRVLLGYFAAALYLFINNTINALSVWSEHSRHGEPSIALWEPFVWEYTSALSVLVILPLMFRFFSRFPLHFAQPKKQLLVHLFGSVVFASLHILLMVALREMVYVLNTSDYNFGPIAREFWYEYRKDAWGYVIWMMLYNITQLVYARLKGEASVVASSEQEAQDSKRAVPEHFLVKKLDKEFLVKVADIEYLESAGNYVNLYSQGRIYPLRATLGELCQRLSAKGFSRVHRSYGVNHNAVDSISYQPSGDGEITLKSGKKLNLSRRYKDEFKQSLS
ncbi:LytTR family transcriptional regulator [Pseudoalteromonas sp. JBTF-M23]|uniref:LytTR family transcriptional regulator n=1 Tax=Pseudoalteromonas caenipelagi TaxID=2726988 RepID=A0A849VE87_9GAMM|nr:LytTR family transcriptional regulator [Pseudoalteromonas caenipelagi]